MTTIENAARALAARWLKRDQERAAQGGCDVMLLIDGYMDQAREDVRAVIECLREMTPAMYEALSNKGKLWRDTTSRDVWETFIDGILNEKPEPETASPHAALVARCLQDAHTLTADNWHTEAATLREAAAILAEVPK